MACKNQITEFISKITVLNERYFELEVFEREWANILQLACNHADNRRHDVIIKNIYVYRGFRWDKYHVLLSDVLSICLNEKNIESSVIQNLYPYINCDIDGLDDNDKALFIKYIKYIFNVEYSGVRISSDANKAISGRLSKFQKKISSERNYLSHKHEVDAINKYERNLQDAAKVLKQLKSIIIYLTNVANGMYFLCEHKNFEFHFVKSHKHVNDQIDIILFGESEFALLKHLYEIQRMEFYRNNMHNIINMETS